MPVTGSDQDVAQSFITGFETIGETIKRLLSGASVPMSNGITMLADKDNTGIIYFSHADNMVIDDSSNSLQGIPLEAGDSFQLQVDNVNKVYFLATDADQKLRFIIE